MFLEISQKSQENTCAGVSFLIKLQAYAWACNFIEKETLAKVLPYELLRTIFNITRLVTASEKTIDQYLPVLHPLRAIIHLVQVGQLMMFSP